MTKRLSVATLFPLLLFTAAAAAAPRPSPPRPPASFRRSLDGTWRLLPDQAERYTAADLPATGWRAVKVPLAIQAQFPDLRDFRGAAWYRLDLGPIARPADAGRVLIHFGAVDYQADIYCNGRRVGGHVGGYTPFLVDITAALTPSRPGAHNWLLVRIADPPGPPADFAANYAQIPHGKQSWYAQTSGLWQSVALEFRPASHLAFAHAITAPTPTGAILRGFDLALAHPAELPAGASVRITVIPPDGGPPLTRAAPLRAVAAQFISFPITDGELWSPAAPRLYRFTVALSNGDRLSDEFGLRSITTRGGHLYLNGRLLYLRGALDQSFYPGAVYTPPSLAFLKREMLLARSLGLNILRCHIKVPDPRYLRAADETGMLVWYEIPSWDKPSPASFARAKATLAAMIRRDWNHPAIILQTLDNESWGVDLRRPDQRAWLLGLEKWAKQRLPQRLIVDNSPCCSNFHLRSDLADFHNYNSMPDHAAAWNHFVEEFSRRPKWLFSPYGDAETTGREPLVLSEFGNWGLPILPGRRPGARMWWFSRSFNGNPITVPAGVTDRMAAAGLGRVFPSYNALARATQRHQWESLRTEIQSLRRRPTISGYIITELSDTNWETNGLLTYSRRPKLFGARLAALQQPVVILARCDRSDYQPGEQARLDVAVSNETARRLAGVEARVNGRPVARFSAPAGGVVELGDVLVPIRVSSRRAEAGRQVVRLELLDARGRVLDRRQIPLAVVAKVAPAALDVTIASTLASTLGDARAALATDFPASSSSASNLPVSNQRAQVLITDRWDAPAQAFAAAGGAVVVLPAARSESETIGPLRVIPRSGDLSGDWITNFNWLDTSRPPARFLRGLGPLLGAAAAAIIPQRLLAGWPASARADVLGGFFLGWVHDAYPVLVQARAGRGRLVVTTLPLARAYGRDPLATTLLRSIIAYAASPACAPRYSLP